VKRRGLQPASIGVGSALDTDKSVRSAVEAELKRRKLEIRSTEGGFHFKDPDGFEVQMGGKRQ
jgi:hypothetical protein